LAQKFRSIYQINLQAHLQQNLNKIAVTDFVIFFHLQIFFNFFFKERNFLNLFDLNFDDVYWKDDKFFINNSLININNMIILQLKIIGRITFKYKKKGLMNLFTIINILSLAEKKN